MNCATSKRLFVLLASFTCLAPAYATPANKAALKRHYGSLLPEALNRCTTCHLPSAVKNPERLEDFPHNAFGRKLREVGERSSIPKRLTQLATEDTDRDGAPNEDEILLGTNPGEASDVPAETELSKSSALQKALRELHDAYQWRPFETVKRPPVPSAPNNSWARNEVDRFVSAEQTRRGLVPRPDAPNEVLMRRAYLDLVGLSPTPAERRRFLQDTSADAYERLVDRLLEDPRYGERWARHWMDIWRYSDWAGWSGGNQIRDSKPHIWRWRDWIVESLNSGKPYAQMIVEMLAADELAPEDSEALRATGFLVRNYKMLSREQWLEDTVKHTSQAFLGVTIGCAKCHDHMTDPIPQTDYYRLRAVFEPHQVRTDKLPGELDTAKVGLVRAYDVNPNPLTYFFVRGDERKADTNRVLKPGVPQALCWDGSEGNLEPEPVSLPKSAASPDRREFVLRETLAASERAVREAEKNLGTADASKTKEAQLSLAAAEARHESLQAVLHLEELQEAGQKDGVEWKQLASSAAGLQKKSALLDAKLKAHKAGAAERTAEAQGKEIEAARKNRVEAEKALAEVEKDFEKGWGTEFKPRSAESYPDKSSGRRLAFARWVTDERNPLTARVAVNHIWLRHFGRGIVSSPENFGANGNTPSHPQLLDWLAAEFMARDWNMKALHRLILTSSTYRMSSTGDERNDSLDPDNIYLWRMASRRLDAELVRDNLLACAGDLDATMGGPEINHTAGLSSKRRSLYLQIAAEKEVEFLKIFNGPSVTECYQRRTTVMPQQALALANSPIALTQAKSLLTKLVDCEEKSVFVTRAFEAILAREPTRAEAGACLDFLREDANEKKSRENLILVLFNHNDFVTIR